ncbi:putative glycolipid transfer protein [Helianthus annuus]|uniref:Glycolipid transfer protein n=1 Tax=Helianthus annuus TaxID=4232 RepID=A0A9K3IUA3_HELAN|nr:putative glycolipid transfer protein [Helianthus annuus]KAJ0561136.1 putative glycolipid transfer protein [Helianthus annuus]KAJ0567689.1 putative glycolipid transfer protein [Helianthus annuus]KAJ0574184.1 putative glycolipid transfer protein [Helianthus annuus]KAJ0738518.1 putative glycolipid transfer protein [Helianthus annuus]
MDSGTGDKPLRKISEAFNAIANTINSQHQQPDLELASFSRACSLVSPLFRCLGIAFKFAEMDYVAKVNDLCEIVVNDLCETSVSILTLQSMMAKDIENNCVRKPGSHTRNLLRVKRGLDMVRVLFEQILASEDNSLKNPASKAYGQVFSPYHGWAIRKAVAAGMYALPTKQQLLQKLNEDEVSARTEMQNYVTASAIVIMYIDKLFQSRNLGIDW